MPLRLDATIELSDDQLARIAEHLRNDSSPMPPHADSGNVSPAVALPDEWRLVEERHAVTYAWPEEADVYEPFRVFEG
ncbi:MAG TPA: hypothetical protein VGI44_08520, partial [Acidimicrobiales bacterium]